MPNTLANLARVASSTTGTGTLTLGSAATGSLTFAGAGVTNGAVVTYAIEDYDGSGNIIAREIGAGTYSTTGPTLTRDTVYSSTNAGSKINCSGLQHVFVTASKEDFASLLTSAAAAAAYQPLDADLTSIAALTTAAYGRGLLETASEANFKATVNLEIGTDVQAYDAELAAIAGLTSAADQLAYFTGSGTAALATFTAAGRAIVDDADASAQRTTLGLGTAAVKNTGASGDAVPLLNVANTFSAAQTISTSTSFATNLYLINTNADNLAAPIFEFYRNSASPTANDVMGMIKFLGNNDVGTQRQFVQIKGVLGDPTNTSEDSSLAIVNYQAGAFTQVALFGLGVYIGSPTGFEKGTGTLNAVTLYENGTSLAAKYGALASANVWTAAQTVRIDSAATNTVTVAATLSSTSTGTPAAGIGVALNFEAETAAGNNEVGARISAVTTDVTSTSEDFDIVLSAMAAGAAVAEVGRHKSTGTYKMPVFTVANLPAGTAGEISFASNGRKNGEGAAAGTGILVFHDGTAWRACDTGATVAA